MAYFADLTEAVGRTPLVRVNRLVTPSDSLVLAKLEFYNPAGSVKDRLG
ncbi:MAG: cysteine synthase A, partial [Propionibacteriaceae bacterium]|nr:cysteine synthase A [Propionibacteriaceae bacterium]